ncbi:MAG: HEAT repeat domain-containing protein [Spirochaetes bacterium]|nr:HEAT repeat domain-containing protein [Spirochaetota bacterium]
MLNDPDDAVRTVATLKFAEIGAPLGSRNLIELIAKGAWKDKIELLKIIASRGPNVDGPIIEVIVLALADKKDIVRYEAVHAAGATRRGHLVPHIAACLRERHSIMRVQVAHALCNIGDEQSVDYLIGLLADSNEEVRETARACLQGINSDLARRVLHDARFAELLRGMGDLEPVRKETAIKIGHEMIREGLPLLHRACSDRYKEVRLAAARSIAAFASPSSVECVSVLLKDRFYDVRLAAVRALGGIRSRDAVKALNTALGDKNDRVRDEAERVLKQLRAMGYH